MGRKIVYQDELIEPWSDRYDVIRKVHLYDHDTDRTRCGREPSTEWSRPSLGHLSRDDLCSRCFDPGEVFIIQGKLLR